jgi:hypothetical protein
MTYILIMQLILGTTITTVTTGYETAYPCYELADRYNKGLEALEGQLEEWKGAEVIARCYKATKSSPNLAPLGQPPTIPALGPAPDK